MVRSALAALLCVGLIAAAALGVDAAARLVIEHRLATEASAALGGAQEPSVDIGGFPFLTQLARGRLADVQMSSARLSVEDLEITDVAVRARDVTVGRPARVGHLELAGTVTPDSLSRAVAGRTGVSLQIGARDGALSASTRALGVPLEIDLAPQAGGAVLVLETTAVRLGGLSVDPSALPGGLGDRLQRIELPLTGLPDGLRLTDARASSAGLTLALAGTDVVLEG